MSFFHFRLIALPALLIVALVMYLFGQRGAPDKAALREVRGVIVSGELVETKEKAGDVKRKAVLEIKGSGTYTYYDTQPGFGRLVELGIGVEVELLVDTHFMVSLSDAYEVWEVRHDGEVLGSYERNAEVFDQSLGFTIGAVIVALLAVSLLFISGWGSAEQAV